MASDNLTKHNRERIERLRKNLFELKLCIASNSVGRLKFLSHSDYIDAFFLHTYHFRICTTGFGEGESVYYVDYSAGKSRTSSEYAARLKVVEFNKKLTEHDFRFLSDIKKLIFDCHDFDMDDIIDDDFIELISRDALDRFNQYYDVLIDGDYELRIRDGA